MIIAGCILLTTGFTILTTFGPGTSRALLIAVMTLLGSGLGLTMVTLVIAVQNSVPRAQLGVATSLNQLARNVGGAAGVAVMGALLSVGLATNLRDAASKGIGRLTPEQAVALAAHPNALIEPLARAALPAETLVALQTALAAALRNVFRLGAALTGLALLIVFLWLPRSGIERNMHPSKPPEKGDREVFSGADNY
jgi:MFS family permease